MPVAVRTVGKTVVVMFAVLGVVLSVKELRAQAAAPLSGFALAHIGIIVTDVNKMIPLYEEAFGIKIPPATEYGPLSVPPGTPGAATSKVRMAQFKIGDTVFELLQPLSGPGPHRDHLDKVGQGLQHIAFKVNDPTAAVKYLLTRGGKRTLRPYVDMKDQLGFTAEIVDAPPY